MAARALALVLLLASTALGAPRVTVFSPKGEVKAPRADPFVVACPEKGTAHWDDRTWSFVETPDGVATSADGREIGEGSRTVLWPPEAGRHELTLVDTRGRARDAVRFVVRGGVRRSGR